MDAEDMARERLIAACCQVTTARHEGTAALEESLYRLAIIYHDWNHTADARRIIRQQAERYGS